MVIVIQKRWGESGGVDCPFKVANLDYLIEFGGRLPSFCILWYQLYHFHIGERKKLMYPIDIFCDCLLICILFKGMF